MTTADLCACYVCGAVMVALSIWALSIPGLAVFVLLLWLYPLSG